MKFFENNTDTKVFALGGLGEVGKNMYCIMHGNELVFIEEGSTNFMHVKLKDGDKFTKTIMPKK